LLILHAQTMGFREQFLDQLVTVIIANGHAPSIVRLREM
jgi:hypothetical protein